MKKPGGLDRFRLRASRQLRGSQTTAEAKLWSCLWQIPLEGSHFRRQAPIGNFIVDFASHRLKLVIELDGIHHAETENAARDAKRTAWLELQGYRVVRFWNSEVFDELDSVLDTIHAAVEERRQQMSTPPRR